MMDSISEDLLEVREHLGSGYEPLIDFESWRVAILRWVPCMHPEEASLVERHTHTDEVFVLLSGRARLIVAGNDISAGELFDVAMRKGKLYNVKQNAWHTVLLSRDGSILIVENRDTGEANTEYCALTPDQRQAILAMDFSP